MKCSVIFFAKIADFRPGFLSWPLMIRDDPKKNSPPPPPPPPPSTPPPPPMFLILISFVGFFLLFYVCDLLEICHYCNCKNGSRLISIHSLHKAMANNSHLREKLCLSWTISQGITSLCITTDLRQPHPTCYFHWSENQFFFKS